MKDHTLKNQRPTNHYTVLKPDHIAKGEQAEIESHVLKEIHKEIESLPGLCKELFKLIFFHGMNTAEAARKLHIPYKTALKHQQQALASLRFTVLKQCLIYQPEATIVEGP